MRISDWSSDVCSSDLQPGDEAAARHVVAAQEYVEPGKHRQRKEEPRRHGEHHRVPLRRADEVGYPFQQPSSRRAAHARLQQREDGTGGEPHPAALAELVASAVYHQTPVDDLRATADATTPGA